jgi:glycosyltransferase involved in cell wall biosynthesis
MEALAAGLPAVCLDHHGARSVIKEEFGAIVQPAELISAIQHLLNDENLPNMRVAARSFALKNQFSDQAAKLAKLLV